MKEDIITRDFFFFIYLFRRYTDVGRRRHNSVATRVRFRTSLVRTIAGRLLLFTTQLSLIIVVEEAQNIYWTLRFFSLIV